MKDFYFQSNKRWGALQPNHRIEIRKALATSLELPEDQFFDLKKRPNIPEMSISISHSDELGAFVWAKNKQSMGMDLEPLGAVQENVILRVSNKEELAKAPSATHLWCAKEAIFKAASKFGLKVISEIRVDWKSETEFVWTGYGNRSVEGLIPNPEGRAWQEAGYVFCLYMF